MPTCPNCRNYCFGTPTQCPECYYDFVLKSVRKPPHIIEQEQRKIEQERQEQLQKEAEETQKREQEKARQVEIERKHALSNSPRYEYQTVYIEDSKDGALDKNLLQKTLTKYANEGWRLHSIFTNEIGKNVSPEFLGGTRNATIEETILIFERCIKLQG